MAPSRTNFTFLHTHVYIYNTYNAVCCTFNASLSLEPDVTACSYDGVELGFSWESRKLVSRKTSTLRNVTRAFVGCFCVHGNEIRSRECPYKV